MLSKNEPQAAPAVKTGKVRNPAPLMDPRSEIEAASGGSGTTNNPPGQDKPPGIDDLELLAGL